MTKVLVLANETIAGEKLLDAILARRGDGVSFHVVVPRASPRHGNIVYDEVVRDSAQVRVDLARAWMRENGIASSGEVGDPDPYLAAIDAIASEGIDEVIVSTLPAAARRPATRASAPATGSPRRAVRRARRRPCCRRRRAWRAR